MSSRANKGSDCGVAPIKNTVTKPKHSGSATPIKNSVAYAPKAKGPGKIRNAVT